MILSERYSLQYHKTLNRKLFSDNDTLLPEVRNVFLKIATVWASFAGIPDDAIADIIFTGGNCNYNYSRFSDCDVHIVYDRNKFPDREDWLESAKKLWSLEHGDIRVKGYQVELYAQVLDDRLVASGVYSLTRNGWIIKPVHGNYKFKNDPALFAKVEGIRKVVSDLIDNHGPDDAISYWRDKIKRMRKAAMVGGDEFSFDNSVFKALRNSGILDKMNRYAAKKLDRELSL